jgi:hypothetical protein
VLARSILQGDVIAFQETVQSPQFVEDRPWSSHGSLWFCTAIRR